MVIHEFEIPGKIKGKARPRMTRAGRTYTPQDTISYENLVKCMYKESGGPFLEGAIGIEICCYFRIPVSTSKKKRESMIKNDVLPKKKPDWDNIGKIICDALNGIAYADDAQIVDANVSKFYTSEGERVRVKIWEIWEPEGKKDEDHN